ncbi:MAG: hypothetical protein IPI65_13785 [Bacteroidetes bacterium]|nr:hypothetical protein [Bacteroidota bacterium]
MLNKQNAELAIINTQLNQQIAINTMRQNVTQAINDLKAAIAILCSCRKNLAAAQSAFRFC